MGVEEAYLDTAFAALREAHGSVEAYLAEVLEVDAARADALRARYLTA